MSLVAVGEDIRAHAGAIAMWRLHGDVDPLALSDAWVAQCLSMRELPTLPGPDAALRRALDEFRARRALVRPLARKGHWTLVDESLTNDGNGLHHVPRCVVKLDMVGRLAIDTTDPALAERVRAEFVRHMEMFSTADVSAWLIRQCERLQAVSLKPNGGVYFIPRGGMDEWQRIVRAVERAGAATVTEVPAMPTESVVRGVLAALHDEATAAYDAIAEEVGAEVLSVRALETRTQRCNAIAAKVQRYEALLGAELSGLATRLTDLRAGIAAAMMRGDSETGT